MITEQTVEITKELRDIISQIKGVKGISEGFVLQFLALVSDEEAKANVLAVAEKLEEQAQNFGFELRIIATTQEELEKVKNEMGFQKSTTTFQ